MLDKVGLPNGGINLSLSDGSQISPADGEILIALAESHHPTADYMKKLRKELPKAFPGTTFYFAPSDIATQVLNFGLPAPIDVQILRPKAAQQRLLLQTRAWARPRPRPPSRTAATDSSAGQAGRGPPSARPQWAASGTSKPCPPEKAPPRATTPPPARSSTPAGRCRA